MKMCENCGKNIASVRLVYGMKGAAEERWLCTDCAAVLGLRAILSPFNLRSEASSFLRDIFGDGLSDDELMSRLFGAMEHENREHDDAEENSSARLGIPQNAGFTVCPTCGTSFDAFKSGERNGCEDCVPLYKLSIEKAESEKSETRTKLENQLTLALETENYEEAAILRDCLKKLSDGD